MRPGPRLIGEAQRLAHEERGVGGEVRRFPTAAWDLGNLFNTFFNRAEKVGSGCSFGML